MPEGEASSDPRHAAAEQLAKGKIEEALQTGAVRESTGLPEHLRHLSEQNQALEIDLKRTFAQQEVALRRMYAKGILWLLGTELLIANAVFVAFAWAGEQWRLEPVVIDVWLGATVIQVVGIVLVVTRHLFPQRDSAH